MDILTGSSQNFFVLIASFSFTLFAAARAVESLRDFHQSLEDLLHLNLMLLQAIVVLAISIMPLILSSIQQCVNICCYVSFILSGSLIIQLIWKLLKRQITFHYKRTSYLIVSMGIGVSIAFLLNAVFWGSILIYRVLLTIGFLLLCFRYYLVLGHFISNSSKFKN